MHPILAHPTLYSSAPSPAWTIVLANILIFVHMLAAAQLFSQVIFGALELQLHAWWPSLRAMRAWLLRLVVRSAAVCLWAVLACIVPLFTDFVGLVGALAYWPTFVLFPLGMWVRMHATSKRRYVFYHTLSAVLLALSVAALIGSIRSIIVDAGEYRLFH